MAENWVTDVYIEPGLFVFAGQRDGGIRLRKMGWWFLSNVDIQDTPTSTGEGTVLLHSSSGVLELPERDSTLDILRPEAAPARDAAKVSLRGKASTVHSSFLFVSASSIACFQYSYHARAMEERHLPYDDPALDTKFFAVLPSCLSRVESVFKEHRPKWYRRNFVTTTSSPEQGRDISNGGLVRFWHRRRDYEDMMEMLLDLVRGLPQCCPSVPQDRLTITQSMLWFALNGLGYGERDLLGGKNIRQFLYTMKNVLDNYLQHVPGGPCHCPLMRVMYENVYEYDQNHEDGGLPWIYNTVVRIVLEHCVSQRVRRVLLQPGRYEGSKFMENSIEDLVEVWSRDDVQSELAELLSQYMAVKEREFQQFQTEDPLPTVSKQEHCPFQQEIPFQHQRYYNQQVRFNQQVPSWPGRVESDPIWRACMLATGLVTTFDLTMDGAPLQVGTCAEWMARLASVQERAYLSKVCPLLDGDQRRDPDDHREEKGVNGYEEENTVQEEAHRRHDQDEHQEQNEENGNEEGNTVQEGDRRQEDVEEEEKREEKGLDAETKAIKECKEGDCQPTAETKLSWADMMDESDQSAEDDRQRQIKEVEEERVEEHGQDNLKVQRPWRSRTVLAFLQRQTQVV
ncbi:hypothetical protein BR93DRAFT_962128 [Coniochaeta sp. PMI_546]|nr:hypothetical protein BR93DRAFT_962128 [Coniochaeta sp. PMI_546]